MNETTHLTTGSRLRALRKARGWTIGGLSMATNISQRQLIKYEQDQVSPKVSTLDRILRVWGVSHRQFFDAAIIHSQPGSNP